MLSLKKYKFEFDGKKRKRKKMIILGTMAVALFGLTACSSKENKKNSDSNQNITKAGTYEFSGDINGSIVVDAGKEDEITLVLNGVNLKSQEDAAIKIIEAKKVTITLEEGSKNIIEDASKRDTVQSSESETTQTDFDAAIYSKADLYLNGTGELEITGNYGDGIAGKDSVYIEEGTYKVQATKHGITGKDYLEIQGGSFAVNCEKDSFHSNGEFLIQKGSFSVECGDDAFHAETALKIEDGTLDIIRCNEGLEGESVTIAGGKISIVSSDDGINAASSEETTDTATNQRENPFEVNSASEIRIEGGDIYINAEGDGMDSNGSIVVTGGIVKIDGSENGGNGALDYVGTFDVSGGSVIAVGAANMAQGISDSSSVYGIMMTCDTQISSGVPVTLVDEQGEVLQYTPAKKYNSVVIADSRLEQGKNYTLKIGDDISVAFTISETVTYLNKNGVTEAQNGMNGGWGKGGKRGDFDKTQIPDGTNLEELPEGMEIPEGTQFPEGKGKTDGTQFPEGMDKPDRTQFSEEMVKPDGTQIPEGMVKPDRTQIPEGMESSEETNTSNNIN